MSTNPMEDEPKKKKKRPDLPIVSIKNTADYQRMKLERLMANPDKPVTIPVRPKEKNLPPPPDFVRNIMGSSAGAGSGEFHVYRHLRRKEYARQKTIQEQARMEEREAQFKTKVEEKQKIADERTAKNRTKRLKKKAARQKNKGKSKPGGKAKSSSSSSSSSENEDETKAEIDLSKDDLESKNPNPATENDTVQSIPTPHAQPIEDTSKVIEETSLEKQ